MTTLDDTVKPIVAGSKAMAATEKGPRLRISDSWWRHVVAIFAVVIAVFPAAYVVSAAFNGDQSISGATLIPHNLTLDNFHDLFRPPSDKSETAYPRWFVNSIFIAIFTATFTVLIGSLAAYAFSRFRFKGRRMGMLFLLLVQMFPQLLMLVSIYLIVLRSGEVFPALGLNHLFALGLVYLGGALGVNVWLMKGFFDSIPHELDESARVDGATPAQIFWGVVLPLAAPVLAVVGLFSFVATFNEFAIASVLLEVNDKRTLPLGLQIFIDQQYGERWGPFAAGVLIAAIPAVILFAYLQKFIVGGLTQGSVKG